MRKPNNNQAFTSTKIELRKLNMIVIYADKNNKK